MFHAVARMIVGSKVDQKGVGLKIRRSPHCGFSSDNFLNATDQSRPFATFIAKRMDHDSVSFTVNLKFIHGPIRSYLGGCIINKVTIGELPLALVGPFGPPV